MSNRLKINTISNSIIQLNDSIDTKITEVSLLQEELIKLITIVLNEENLFKDSKWDICLQISGPALKYSGSDDDFMLEPFYLLCTNSVHHSISLEDGVELRLDEDRIYFDDVRLILPFVNKHKIKIVKDNILDKLQVLKRESSVLEILAHQFANKK